MSKHTIPMPSTSIDAALDWADDNKDMERFSLLLDLDGSTSAGRESMIPDGNVVKALVDAVAEKLISELQILTGPAVMTLKIKQAGYTAKTVDIPIASTSNPGLLTPAEKEKLDFDTTPTKNSMKGVTSSGVYLAIGTAIDNRHVALTQEEYDALLDADAVNPNVFYYIKES